MCIRDRPIGHKCVGRPRERLLEDLRRQNSQQPCSEDDDDDACLQALLYVCILGQSIYNYFPFVLIQIYTYDSNCIDIVINKRLLYCEYTEP